MASWSPSRSAALASLQFPSYSGIDAAQWRELRHLAHQHAASQYDNDLC